MTWHLFAEGRRTIIAPGVVYSLGRDATCDIVITGHQRVSRRHLEISVDATTNIWTVTDQSANGTAGPDGMVTSATGADQIAFLLGGATGPLVVLSNDVALDVSTVESPVWPERSRPPVSGSGSSGIDLGPITRFGRAADNNVVIDSLLASPHHAHLLREDGRLTLIDLASSRGTFVNGVRIKQHVLSTGDVVTMGGQSFRVDSDGELRTISLTSGVPLEVQGITVTAGALTLLHDVSISVAPRSLVGVVGPSGSGKSTMLGALTGLRPAASGRVLVDGQDLYASYDEWRYRIGFVPQQDLVPPQLTVRSALTYAAKLRFPSDTTAKERKARVEQVMEDLSLTQRADLRIDRLSGGQRKRVSVALELLTRPPVLFLDEPTSGLDPGLDQQLMMLLRELADDGRTVMVVTHAMDNLGLCDNVLVLAAGGHVAYFGPPATATSYFGAKDWPGVFRALDSQPGPEWTRRYTEWVRRTSDSSSATPASQRAGQRMSNLPAPRKDRASHQFATLVSRTWKVTVSDRAYLTLLALLPVVLAALGFLVGNSFGLGPSDVPGGVNPDARILLLVLILGAAFTGAATSIQELVKERVIYQRERAVGLSRAAYIGSKALVLGIISAIQGAVFAFLTLAGRPGPDNPLLIGWGIGETALLIAALAVTSCMVGLALSALIPTREATLPVLVIVTMLQVVLSGAIPLRWNGIDDVVGLIVPAAWDFKALAAVTDLTRLLGPGADQTWSTSSGSVVGALAVLGLMTVVLIIVATGLARRSDPGRR